MRQCVLVVRFARTGSSALCAMLQSMRVDFRPDLCKPPSRLNKNGFFEKVLLHLNNSISRYFSLSWTDMSYLPENRASHDEVLDLCQPIKETIKKDFKGSRLFGLGNPWLDKLQPIYHKILYNLEFAPKVVVMHRDSSEIVISWRITNFLGSKKKILEQDQIIVSFYEHPASCMPKIQSLKVDFKDLIERANRIKKQLVEFISSAHLQQSTIDRIIEVTNIH